MQESESEEETSANESLTNFLSLYLHYTQRLWLLLLAIPLPHPSPLQQLALSPSEEEATLPEPSLIQKLSWMPQTKFCTRKMQGLTLPLMIKYTKCSHYTYDMHDVFLIIYPKDGAGANMVSYTKNLYSEYADISIKDVARSNKWYQTWMNEEWFVQNLQLTHTFFQNNVSDNLWMKVSETYESFKAGEKGGPLFFILMMNHLLLDTEKVASALVTKVKTFEIHKITGKDIYKVVSLLCGAINHLNYIHKLPEDIIKILLQVL
jgi:hypothetical protein